MTTETDAAPAPVPYAYGGSGEYPGYVPPQPTPVPPTPRPRSYLGLATVSIAVIVTGVLVSLDATGVADVPFVVILASALGILGLGLLVGAFVGRARWLVALAIPLLLVTAPIAMIPADFGSRIDAGIGERSWVPRTPAQASTPFELSVGSAELDLTRLVIPAGTTTIPVDASVGLGELIVTVPDDVRVLVDAEVGLGGIDVEGLPRAGRRRRERRRRAARRAGDRPDHRTDRPHRRRRPGGVPCVSIRSTCSH